MAKVLKMRIRDHHIDKVKFDKVVNYAQEMGVLFTFYGHKTIVSINGTEYDLEDVDSGDQVSEFPPIMDYKLTYEKVVDAIEEKRLLDQRKALK